MANMAASWETERRNTLFGVLIPVPLPTVENTDKEVRLPANGTDPARDDAEGAIGPPATPGWLAENADSSSPGPLDAPIARRRRIYGG